MTNLGIGDVLAPKRRGDLEELFRFWSGGKSGPAPRSDEDLRELLRAWMSDPLLVEERVTHLGKRLHAVVESLITAPRYQRSWKELSEVRDLSYLSEYDLEACLSTLGRCGLVAHGDDPRFEKAGGRVVGVPREVGDGLVERRRERMRGIFGTLTLRGHLDQSYASSDSARPITPQRLRELYKMYSQETASIARIDRLPEGVKGLVEKAILEFGGILPRQLFERMETQLPHWNGRRWAMILEQSLVGTVQDLDLSRYGIQLQDETLVVFNEVALAWLRRVAVPGDPDRPYEELSLGIDVASNISRFLAYIEENGVRFTVRGEIFKTTEKKILQHLIPNPGRELAREEVLRFIFRFAKRRGLIDRTGNRTFAVTPAGRTWDSLDLLAKQQQLFDFVQDERQTSGERFHEQQTRRILMRLLKRVEPGTWYDLMYLPFLARNTYLTTLDDLQVEEALAERSVNGRFPSMEDPQRLAWNLIRWVRQRLYLTGIVDLGYDASEHPVALRLTQAGARLLGMDVPEEQGTPRMGSLVVTPDFEIVLFPTGDDGEIIHDLDRFCARDKKGQLLHFQITQEGVARALRRGMTLEGIQGLLERHSRTPVPQNVTFSIRDWALRAGLMRLSDRLVLVCEEPDVLRRFQQDAGTRKYIAARIDDRSVRLKGRITPKRMQALLRDLGFVVELGDPLV